MRLKFRITLLSDYHIGAGYGKGVIDSVILKDKNGTPIIRGTTLSGLLRQGMWELLQLELLKHHRKCKQSGSSGRSYCMETDEEQICPICRILGSPIHPKRWNISSAVIEKPSIQESGKIVWRNRVNPRLRTAEERKLFNEETAGGKISFIFTVNNESDDTRVLEEASFIVAALRMIRYIGASRRRGKGLCEFHLIKITPELPEIENMESTSYEDKLLEIFKIKWLENKDLTIGEKNEQVKQTREITPTKRSFNLVLLTEEPLLIANRGESGNRFQTIDYIPGYTILGALAWKVANRCDLTNEAIYEKFINLFRKGGIKVSPLYPCWKIENDVYPAILSPLDFLTCKLHPGFDDEGGHGAKGFAIVKDEPKNCSKCLENGLETPLQPLNRFVPLHPKPKTLEVAKREEMHISIDPKTGITKAGDLFSYTSIESEQYFMGTVEIDSWVDFVKLLGIDVSQDDISFELRLGKASSRGYGLAKIWLLDEKNTSTTFLGKPIEKRINDIASPIIMTLLTDTILTDRWGRYYTTLDSKILEQILGVEVEVINTYVKTKNIDGFNTYLGLPKWRDCVLVAGSSIGFKVKSSKKEDKLIERFEELEKDGIGLRRNEGFGRVAFNHPIYSESRCSVSIRLEAFMRIHKPEEKIKNFENWWQEYLAENLHQSDFSREEWRAIARWFKENSKVPLDEINKMFSKDLNFHKPEEITSFIEMKNSLRDKKEFLSDKGQEGLKKLQNAFNKLSHKISQEDEEIREYMQFKAIEMLADFIASLMEG